MAGLGFDRLYVGCTSRPEDSEAVWALGGLLGELYG